MVVPRSAHPGQCRAGQRARLWAITWAASQAPLAAKRPEGRWFSPTPYFRSRMTFLHLGVAAMVGFQFQCAPLPVGDEAVIAVAGEEGQLGTGRGPHPPDDEPHRRGVGLGSGKRCIGGLGHIGPALHPVGDGRPVRSSGIASMRLCMLWRWRMVMEQRTFVRRQTATTAWV